MKTLLKTLGFLFAVASVLFTACALVDAGTANGFVGVALDHFPRVLHRIGRQQIRHRADRHAEHHALKQVSCSTHPMTSYW